MSFASDFALPHQQISPSPRGTAAAATTATPSGKVRRSAAETSGVVESATDPQPHHLPPASVGVYVSDPHRAPRVSEGGVTEASIDSSLGPDRKPSIAVTRDESP